MEGETEAKPEITVSSPAASELTRAERRKLKRLHAKEGLKQERQKEAKKSATKKIILASAAVIIIVGIGFLVFSGSAKAKTLDGFAQCLTEKGAVIYGNEWCSYTQRQKNMFGDSFKKLNYVICDRQKALCDEKQITTTPTWEINGNMHREVQKLETLSKLSGCPLQR